MNRRPIVKYRGPMHPLGKALIVLYLVALGAILLVALFGPLVKNILL